MPPRKPHDPLRVTSWPSVVPLLAQGAHLPLLATVSAMRSAGKKIFPAQGDIFRALLLTPPEKVRVVILGQDPYHGAGQAHGLAFSVPAGMPCPRSLGNIFKEIRRDVGGPIPCAASPNLERWARQGVLLLNTVLTVEEGKAHSHAKLAAVEGGWQKITSAVLTAVALGARPVAVLLWGREAQNCAPLFQKGQEGQEGQKGQQGQKDGHCVLCAAHPSPLSASRGFFGCGHFSKVNAWLTARKEEPIDWA